MQCFPYCVSGQDDEEDERDRRRKKRHRRPEDADAADKDVAHMMDDLSSDRAFMCRVGLGEINRKMGVVMTQPR